MRGGFGDKLGRVGVPTAIIGAGSFGTALSMLCARENEVSLWARSSDVVDTITRERHNPRHLSDFELPANITATTDLPSAVEGRELVIIAVPSHSLRAVMTLAAPHLLEGAILVSAVKGIELESGKTMSGVLEEVLPAFHHPRITCLSGPSFAREIAEQRPTVVTIACREEAYAIAVQATLSCEWFRCYSSCDVIGVEVGGALKNVIAIAVGISDGMGAGLNTRAALMTRGLAELTRLATKLGGDPATLNGLSGMGDLVLTCTGDLSRNRRVGLALGRGRKLQEIITELGEVAEGVETTRAACRLAERVGVELPIAEMVRQVLDGERTPVEAGEALMTRQLRSEHDFDR
jgi:glycerol-3-phosphate dehydrogenase (NAD(P)+)